MSSREYEEKTTECAGQSGENEEKVAACAAYFLEREGYGRAFERMRGKWRQYGRAAGTIRLEHPTAAERQALEGFFAKEFPGNVIRFSAKEFEAALGQTRFGNVTLGALLGAYFQEKLITHQEEKKRELQRKEQFFRELQETAGSYGCESAAAAWLRCAVSQKKYGYRVILAEYERAPGKIRAQVEQVCRALDLLGRERGIRLAVLGAKVTGNPHEFDRNTVCGKLLLQALSCIRSDLPCRSAEEILMLYYAFGVKPDDISSFTTACGIHLYTEEGEHPAYRSFLEMGEPFVVTLSNLSRIRRADARERRVYVVENQMVFSHLCGALAGQETALVCTSGQVKTASWMLLDLLCEAGCTLYYCGDLDPEGLGIAEKVLTRYGAHAGLWHMSRADYDRSVSAAEISPESLAKLAHIHHPELQEVKEAILARKKAGYQEQLLEWLERDMRMHLPLGTD